MPDWLKPRSVTGFSGLFGLLFALGSVAIGAILYMLAGLAFESVLVALLAAGAAVGVERLIAPRFPVTLEVPVSSYFWLPLLAGSAGLLACLR